MKKCLNNDGGLCQFSFVSESIDYIRVPVSVTVIVRIRSVNIVGIGICDCSRTGDQLGGGSRNFSGRRSDVGRSDVGSSCGSQCGCVSVGAWVTVTVRIVELVLSFLIGNLNRVAEGNSAESQEKGDLRVSNQSIMFFS